MKPLGSFSFLFITRYSKAGSSAGRFCLAPTIFFLVAPEGPAAACCYYRAGGVDGGGLEVPAWSLSPEGSQRWALKAPISTNT